MDKSKFLTSKEAANFVGVNFNTINRAIKNGELTNYGVKGKHLLNSDEVDKFKNIYWERRNARETRWKQKTCDVCGREVQNVRKKDGYYLCDKHLIQLQNFGKFLDNNPRNHNDLNEITVEDNIAKIQLYDLYGNPTAEAIIDSFNVEKVKKYKWRYSTNGYVETGQHRDGNHMKLHWLVLDLSVDEVIREQGLVVDHINHDPLCNLVENLRVVTPQGNATNRSVGSNNNSGFSGINYVDAMQKWHIRVRLNEKEITIGYYSDFTSALYCRLVGEIICYKDVANKEKQAEIIQLTQNIDPELKKEIEHEVIERVNGEFLGIRNTTGFKGVSWSAAYNKWVSERTIEGQRCKFGRYIDFIEAVYSQYSVNKFLGIESFQTERMKIFTEVLEEDRKINIDKDIERVLMMKGILESDKDPSELALARKSSIKSKKKVKTKNQTLPQDNDNSSNFPDSDNLISQDKLQTRSFLNTDN